MLFPFFTNLFERFNTAVDLGDFLWIEFEHPEFVRELRGDLLSSGPHRCLACCGSLAKEIQECQIQMIAVKPIARWQVWPGITALNFDLLLVSGIMVLGLLYVEGDKLHPEQHQQLKKKVPRLAPASLSPSPSPA
ncbi:MAG: hypothetical protein M2R45_03512 [Verrucomicrobia subdivision 3 bacterium]|nr:hypothetical protein [Limisphaerales bacterium]MCS1415908.1 hypothetical protein [Limisphaerales bacterium]